MDFISIIVAAYNAEKWLDRCLTSVVDAMDVDCEVIIVNDGSADGTRDIARRYVDSDARISLVDIPHSGPCAARKAGFVESQGDYIMFVDSDDTLPVNSIHDQRRLLNLTHNDADTKIETRPLAIVCNTIERSERNTQLLISGQRRWLTGKEYVHEILTKVIPGFLPGHLYARVLLEGINWDDDPSITHYEHNLLTLSMGMKMDELMPNQPAVLIDASVSCYNYMRRPGSQSALLSLTPNGLEKVWEHLNKLGLPEPEFTYWGLNTIYNSFIERGIPFESNLTMAVDLRIRAKKLGVQLPEFLREVVNSLDSTSKRAKIARRLARTGGLTSIAPHLSFIIVCNRNISRVRRSLDSIFHTGLRNIEVVLVDLDNTHGDSVELTALSTCFPRVRLIKANPGIGVYSAAVLGLDNVSGLCVMFIRPGDLVGAEGIHNAVTHIDYGAEVVLVNHRHFSPVTRLRSGVFSYSYLRSTDKARKMRNTPADRSEDIYDNVVEALKAVPNKGEQFNIYGVVWRRSVLKNTGLDAPSFADLDRPAISHRAMRHLLDRKLRVIAQDHNVPATYEFATDSLIRHAVSGRLAFFLF